MADASSGAGDRATLSFASAGKSIGVDWHRAARPGIRPAVLMLHGRDGPDRFADAYRFAARELSERGYHVLFVHYFDASTDDTLFGGAGLANFFAWMRVVEDCVGWAGSQADVDPERVAVLGVSLGASIALAQASQDRRIKAVIDFYGMLPLPALAMTHRMPATLILHGAQDWVVHVAAAYQLDAFLKTIGATHETHIYPDAGHGFRDTVGADAVRRTIAFLDRHVGEHAG
ncbi:MAG TPA: dienelactone hydrolase family protein [Stellaceae bacterium]|jgi:carboxymethylenebutenolidase|nr:dienelactone hydrolase family protein [Stellaceae bacterium]